MELTNEFRVGVPPAEAWAVLTDVERIAPCLPGAQLLEVEGDEYRGTVKVKVGPITATYKGAATFVERDEAGGRAVLRAEGREARGQGNASALITATLTPDGDGTAVKVATDLTITGRVAQFGRGVLADVSAKLLDQFVACLEQTVLGPSPIAAALAGEPPARRGGAAARPVKAAASIPGVPTDDDPLAGSEWMAADAEPAGADAAAPAGPDAAAPADIAGAPAGAPAAGLAPPAGTPADAAAASSAPAETAAPADTAATESGDAAGAAGRAATETAGAAPASDTATGFASGRASSDTAAGSASGTAPDTAAGRRSTAPSAADPSDTGGAPGPADRDVAPPVPDVSGDATATGPRRIESAPATPVDLLGTAGAPVAKRALPVAGVLVVVVWLFRRRRRRRARA